MRHIGRIPIGAVRVYEGDRVVTYDPDGVEIAQWSGKWSELGPSIALAMQPGIEIEHYPYPFGSREDVSYLASHLAAKLAKALVDQLHADGLAEAIGFAIIVFPRESRARRKSADTVGGWSANVPLDEALDQMRAAVEKHDAAAPPAEGA